jgi:UDP-N-acetylmuramoyl-tripeptide--D-alanyl-D-alanine ligase
MITLSLKQLQQVIQADLIGDDAVFSGISVNSRELAAGNLYIALVGNELDGHDFVREAEAKGAIAVVLSKPVKTKLPYLLVPDSVLALGQIATYWSSQFNLPFIAVTGSHGKTTVKDMIAAILVQACQSSQQVLANKGNFNNHIGLPLTLLRLNAQHKFAVLEMGMNHFGEIDYLCKVIAPDIGVITNACAVHLEGVGDLDGVARAKGELIKGIKKDGIVVLNADDNYFNYWKTLTINQRVMSFSLHNTSDVFADQIKHDDDGSSFVLHTPLDTALITLQITGEHNIKNALAAAAVCFGAGIDIAAIKAGLELMQSVKGRMQIKESKTGAKIIDDTYNAAPDSLKAAIDVLVKYAGTKILALGDMQELGKDEKQLHFAVGQYAKEAGVDYLFAIGDLTVETTKAFGDNAHHFKAKSELINALKPHLKKGVTVLAKGSRSMEMETVVNGADNI